MLRKGRVLELMNFSWCVKALYLKMLTTVAEMFYNVCVYLLYFYVEASTQHWNIDLITQIYEDINLQNEC